MHEIDLNVPVDQLELNATNWEREAKRCFAELEEEDAALVHNRELDSELSGVLAGITASLQAELDKSVAALIENPKTKFPPGKLATRTNLALERDSVSAALARIRTDRPALELTCDWCRVHL